MPYFKDLTIQDSVIESNPSVSIKGESNPVFEDCTFSKLNLSYTIHYDNNRNAIQIESSSSNFKNCQFIYNVGIFLNTFIYADGGNIINTTLEFSDCLFSNIEIGNIIKARKMDTRIINTTFENNSVLTAFDGRKSNLTVINSSWIDSVGTGILLTSDSQFCGLNFQNSKMKNITGVKGGLYTSECFVEIFNSNFSDILSSSGADTYKITSIYF